MNTNTNTATATGTAIVTKERKSARATLITDGGGGQFINLDALGLIPTPEPTKTWTPVPHIDVPNGIDAMVEAKGWSFVDPDPNTRYQIVVNDGNTKMFGAVKVVIPNVTTDAEFEMAIGFRNSHDKSTALRVAVGTNVMVCSNMVITGDIQVRREHTSGIDPLETIRTAFDKIPEAANNFAKWFSSLREMNIDVNDAIAFLAKCVESGALPIGDFMNARANYVNAVNGESEIINHGGTVWSAYQAVTSQYKHHSMNQLQGYTTKLNDTIIDWTHYTIN